MRPPFNVPQLGAPVPYPHRGLLAQVPSLVGWSEPGAQVVSVRSRHVLLFMNPQLTRRHSPTHEQLQLDPRARSGESSRGQRARSRAMTHTHTRHRSRHATQGRRNHHRNLTVSVHLVGQLLNLIDAQGRREVERRRHCTALPPLPALLCVVSAHTLVRCGDEHPERACFASKSVPDPADPAAFFTHNFRASPAGGPHDNAGRERRAAGGRQRRRLHL